MNLNHPMPVMKPKPATFILACALLVLVLAYVKGCAPAPAVGQTILGFNELPTNTRGVAATVKWDRNETGISRDLGIRQRLPVESFAGRYGLQPVSSVEKPSLAVTFAGMVGKTGYEPVQDSRQVPRPFLYATEHQNGLTQPRLADGNLESEPCAWRNTTHSQSHFLCGRLTIIPVPSGCCWPGHNAMVSAAIL
jgi:hypothetical protein